MLLRALLVWTCWTIVASSFTVSQELTRRSRCTTQCGPRSRCRPADAHQSRLSIEETEPNAVYREGIGCVSVDDASALSRRHWVESVVTGGAASAAAVGIGWLTPQAALASGGATAGRYTTIPIAKRRYYGRVQQAVHEFLDIGTEMTKSGKNGGADLTAPKIQVFFDPLGTVIVAAKRKDVNGQCTKKDGDCKGREIRDSRYNDMKASMYLLANAFRTDQQKAPDRLPTVKAAKAFFQQVNELEKLVTKNPKKNDPAAVQRYLAALDILDTYLDLVELPPIDSGHYDQEFDTLVGETARIT